MLRLPRGASLLDRCLFHDKELALGGYNYYGYVGRDGDFFIMKIKVDETEARYASPTDKGYENAWIDKATLDYKYIYEL